jgi:hypothetical protein
MQQGKGKNIFLCYMLLSSTVELIFFALVVAKESSLAQVSSPKLLHEASSCHV